MTTTLFSVFQNAGLTPQGCEVVLSRFTERRLEKEEWLLQEGKVCRHIAFVESGLLQFYVVRDGLERTTYFTGSGGFATSLASFMKETPSRENIRALQPTLLQLVSKEDWQLLTENIPALKNFYLGILEYQIGCIDTTRFDLMVLSAEERYQKMLEEEPELLQQIPQKHLSSMLGITPRHLTRLRSKIR